MKRHSWMLSPGFNLLLLSAVVVTFFLVPSGHAQAYLYGRAGVEAGSNGSVIVADFNGDGRPDLAVSDPQHNQVVVLLGTSRGAFVSAGTYPTGSQPTSLVAADFNRDKKLDLAVVNASAGTISILLGNGDGSFQSHVDYPVGQYPVGLIAASFTGNGNIDLATISSGDGSVAIMLGDGHGGFDVQALIPVPSMPTMLASGDVNGDGKTDLVTCNNNTSPTITVLLSKGDGTFTLVDSQGPQSAEALAVGDFNRDGKLDAVAITSFGGSLSLGNGDGSFQNPISIPNAQPTCCNPPFLLAADFNHDGKLDIAFNGVWTMLGNGDGTFQNPLLSPTFATPMVVSDINGDGEPDLVAFTPETFGSGAVAILLGNGDGTFMDLRSITLTSQYYLTAGVAADFNGDGKLDFAVAESTFSTGQIAVGLGKGNGTFGQPIISSLSSSASEPGFILSADFNGDHKADILAADNNNSGFQILLGNGDGSFGTPVDNPLSYYINSLAVGDFNGDGKADVVIAADNSSNSPSLNILLGNGDGTFTQAGQYVVFQFPSVAVADVNHDGKLDLIVTSENYNLLVFLGNGDGTFKNPIFGPSDSYNGRAVIGDFNHDGKLDIAVGTFNGIAFLPGNGDGTFGTQVYSDVGLQIPSLGFASDFNGDHKLDVAANASGCCSSGPLIMAGNGDGTFGPPLEYDSVSEGFFGISVLAGDFNSDGVTDLGITGSTSSNTPALFLYLSTPTPNVVPTALNFGSVAVGKTSSPKRISLTNAGNSKLKIGAIKVSGDFSEQNNCGTELAIGKSCRIEVSFKPQAKGLRTGKVSILDNSPGKAQFVQLKGTGK